MNFSPRRDEGVLWSASGMDCHSRRLCRPWAFKTPKVVEYIDGDYRTLASCTHQQLGRQYGQLRMTDLREGPLLQSARRKDSGNSRPALRAASRTRSACAA